MCIQKFYLPALSSVDQLKADGYKLTREVTGWLERMTSSWHEVQITDVEVPEMGNTLLVGQRFPITIKVHLGAIQPGDIAVQVVAGKLSSQEQIRDYDPTPAEFAPDQSDDGTFAFTSEVVCRESGRFGITARIIPANEHLPHTFKPKLISWW